MRIAILILLSGFLSFSQAQGQERSIHWRSGESRTPRMQVDGVKSRLQQIATTVDENHFVIQFDHPVTPERRRELRRHGLELLQPLGNQSYFAALRSEDFEGEALSRKFGIHRVERIGAANKVHPELSGGVTPPWSVVNQADPANPTIGAYVLLHQDVTPGMGKELIELSGGVVRDTLESINGLVIEIPRDRIDVLAAIDEVQWVEPPLPRMEGIAWNDSNRSITEADLVQGAPYNLDGTGVTVLVYDGGTVRATHQDYGGRATVRDASGTSFHATHVAATIGGDGSAGGGTWKGMAPGVTIESYGFEYDGSGTFLYSNPGDIEADYDEAINTYGADLSNNSIGSNTEPNGFECNIQGNYGVTAALIDAIVRGSLGAPFRIVWSAGNERQGSRCDLEGHGDYYSMAPPAGAKNHIAVGALNSNDDSMTSFSSWGPTDDGRLKPDVSGPGCQSGGDGGVTSAGSGSDTEYITLCGTSMSGPTVAGLSALLLQDYRAQFGGSDPRNSTLKILLAHTADDGGNPGPDYQFGYGSVRIKDSIDFMRLGQFREDSVSATGSVYRYTVDVDPGDPELKITLAWDDAPGMPNVLPALVNDLDLRVTDPGGTQHFPWTLDPDNPGANAVQSSEDHTNNVEQVQVTSPISGTWTVEVRGFDVPEGSQSFSICSSHTLAAEPFVSIGLLTAIPTVISPGASTVVTAEITATNETLKANSPKLFFRYNGSGAFLKKDMTPLGGDQYQATLPPPVCDAAVEWYVRARGQTSGFAYNPAEGPGTRHTAEVYDEVNVFSDDFESDLGWTVSDVSVTDGTWERGVPAGDGGRNDPLTDFDGSGSCYLTDNVAGNSDVDGGPTRITSPTINLSGGEDYRIAYARWFANDDFDVDTMVVEISNNNGGSWSTAETVANTNGWATRDFLLADVLGATSQMVFRVNVTDNPNDSVTEGAFDAFRIYYTECSSTLKDCNKNGIDDADDISSGRSRDRNGDGKPDECQMMSIFRAFVAGP